MAVAGKCEDGLTGKAQRQPYNKLEYCKEGKGMETFCFFFFLRSFCLQLPTRSVPSAGKEGRRGGKKKGGWGTQNTPVSHALEREKVVPSLPSLDCSPSLEMRSTWYRS